MNKNLPRLPREIWNMIEAERRRMFKKRVESKRYNLKSLTKEFGEILGRVKPEDEMEFRNILLKCCNTKMYESFKKGESVEFSVLNIPLDVWRELRGLTNE